MQYRFKGRIGTLEFQSPDELAEWMGDRFRRASTYFPNESDAIGAIAPTSVSRIVLDSAGQIADAFDALTTKRADDVIAARLPLGSSLIHQLDVRDSGTGLIHQYNIGREADFESSAAPADDGGEVPIVEFGIAYRARGRSSRFTIGIVSLTELNASRKLFAGFCPRCDGLLARTGLKVYEEDHDTLLWDERCLQCNQRFLGWRPGDGQMPKAKGF